MKMQMRTRAMGWFMSGVTANTGFHKTQLQIVGKRINFTDFSPNEIGLDGRVNFCNFYKEKRKEERQIQGGGMSAHGTYLSGVPITSHTCETGDGPASPGAVPALDSRLFEFADEQKSRAKDLTPGLQWIL